MAAMPVGLGPERNESGRERSGPRKGWIVDEEREEADSPKIVRVRV